MKKVFFLFTLITLNQLHAADHEHKSSAAQNTETEQLAQQLIEKYKPTKERCGASIHKSKTSRTCDELSPWDNNDFKGHIACVISGNKDVAEVDDMSAFLRTYPQYQKLLNAYNIQIINTKYGKDVKKQILYTPKGEPYAKLLGMESKGFFKKEFPCNRPSYLIGTLLGYDPEDIDYYYEKTGCATFLKKDKAATQEWIEKHLPEVTQSVKITSPEATKPKETSL